MGHFYVVVKHVLKSARVVLRMVLEVLEARLKTPDFTLNIGKVSMFTNEKFANMYALLMSLDGVLCSGRERNFHRTEYSKWAFRKVWFRFQIQCTSGPLMVLKLPKISPFAHEL